MKKESAFIPVRRSLADLIGEEAEQQERTDGKKHEMLLHVHVSRVAEAVPIAGIGIGAGGHVVVMVPRTPGAARGGSAPQSAVVSSAIQNELRLILPCFENMVITQ